MRYSQIHRFVIVVLLMTGVLGGEVVALTTSSPQRHVVEIRDFAFHPAHIIVDPGDTVVWINKDFVPHFVSLVDGKWQSNALEENQSWKFVVEKAGFFNYVCVFHPEMTGKVISGDQPSLVQHQP